jgi:hypothetical protein
MTDTRPDSGTMGDWDYGMPPPNPISFGVFRRMFDSQDHSIELHDVAAMMFVLTYIVIAAGQAWASGFKPSNPDIVVFATGGGILIGAIVAAGWLKSKSIHNDPPPPPNGVPS